jgi:hypothetical protein
LRPILPFPARQERIALASLDELCVAHVLPLLPVGFGSTRPRRWVRGTRAPLREIFEFQALKGGRYSARWGFSLDFVPLWRGGRLAWKRTDRNAEFDLCIDPIDETGTVPDWCSFADPTAAWRGAAALARAAQASVRGALEDFGKASSAADIPRLFEARSGLAFRRFGLDDYAQTHLAWGLSLIAAGRPAEAQPHLARFCGEYGAAPADPILAKAAALAAASGT